MPIRIRHSNPLIEAWLLLHQTYDSSIKYEEMAFSKINLKPQQYEVLRALKNNIGVDTSTVMANFLDRKPHSITLMVDRLMKKGLVKRLRDRKDRRVVRIVITPEGKKAYEQANETISEVPKEVLAGLTQEELKTFTEILKKIRENTFALRGVSDKVTDVDLTLS